jgi:hypothetical protein
MSTYTHESMINHHGPGILSQIGETLHVCGSAIGRAASWPTGPSGNSTTSQLWSDIAYETEKPFWRA